MVTIYERGAFDTFVIVADIQLPSSLCILTLSTLFTLIFEEALCVGHNIVSVFSVVVLVGSAQSRDLLFWESVVDLMWAREFGTSSHQSLCWGSQLIINWCVSQLQKCEVYVLLGFLY